MMRTNVYLLYHFFHPDDVISARLFSDLGASLADAGCRVVAMPSTARCHDYRSKLARLDTYQGVKIHRVYRPCLSQHRISGRIINTLFLLGGWTWRAIWMRRQPQEVMIVGTDPILAVVIAIAWRLFRPRAKIIHWCHDVYPDAAIADGLLPKQSVLVSMLKRLLRIAYRRCDVIADLGPCMRARLLEAFGAKPSECEAVASGGEFAEEACGFLSDDNCQNAADVKTDAFSGVDVKGTAFRTLVPWALVEPAEVCEPDAEVRRKLFGDQTRLGILYSGNLGRAHHFDSVLKLAKSLRGRDIRICFAGRGPGIEDLRNIVTADDKNVTFAGFANETELASRLTATDIHLVTLRNEWTGSVVPSKFFGALAVGRPVLFAGSPDSAIARWIEKYRIGWVLTDEGQQEVAEKIAMHAESTDQIEDMRDRCWNVYHQQFSKDRQLQLWKALVLGNAGAKMFGRSLELSQLNAGGRPTIGW